MSKVRNTAWSTPRQHCVYCCDQGLVVVQTRIDPVTVVERGEGDDEFNVKTVGETGPIDEMGPCPACEIGKRVDGGIGSEFVRRDGEKVRQDVIRGGPWGAGGYWQGRDWLGVVVRACACGKREEAETASAAALGEDEARKESPPGMDVGAGGLPS